VVRDSHSRGRVASAVMFGSGMVTAQEASRRGARGPCGQHTAVPMALLMVGGAAASLVGLLVIARPVERRSAR